VGQGIKHACFGTFAILQRGDAIDRIGRAAKRKMAENRLSKGASDATGKPGETMLQ